MPRKTIPTPTYLECHWESVRHRTESDAYVPLDATRPATYRLAW